ncbi:hypothetical protein BVRB_042700, partial [Beta vulgaris subsp. vulgaris]
MKRFRVKRLHAQAWSPPTQKINHHSYAYRLQNPKILQARNPQPLSDREHWQEEPEKASVGVKSTFNRDTGRDNIRDTKRDTKRDNHRDIHHGVKKGCSQPQVRPSYHWVQPSQL